MASAQSLMGLMTQLQSMENNFTCILMEAALKLASLTDANIFLLVESTEGRRYAGRPHLCQAYQQGSLGALPNDKEMEADPNISGLREKPMSYDNGSAYGSNHFESPVLFSPPSRKRASSTATEPTLSSSKQRRLGSNGGGGSTSTSFAAAASSSSSSSFPALSTDNNDESGESSASLVPKHESFSVGVKEEAFEVGADDDDGDDSDIEEIYAVESAANENSNNSAVVGHHSMHGGGAAAFHIGNDGGMPVALPGANPSGDQSDLESAMVFWSYEFLQNNRKVEPLKLLTEPSGLVDKTSVERKVLSSLINEMAKELTRRFPPDVKFSRKKAFDTVWSVLDNIQPFQQHPCLYKDKMVPLSVMCYDMFTTAVSCAYHRLKKMQKS